MSDDQYFEQLLAAVKDGPKDIGFLRRERGIGPQTAAYQVEQNPKIFRSFEGSDRKGHIGLRVLEGKDEKVFDDHKRWASPSGEVSLGRLSVWGRSRYTIEDVRTAASRHSDVLEIVSRVNQQGRVTEYLKSKKRGASAPPMVPCEASIYPPGEDPQGAAAMPLPEPQNPPRLDSDIAARMSELILHLQSNFKRDDKWLAEMGFSWPEVKRLDASFPNLIRIELPHKGAHFQHVVSLAPRPEPVEEKPRQFEPPKPVPMPNKMSAQDTAIFGWKPAAPGQMKAKGIHPQKVIHRKRNPLVTLPPDPPKNS